MNVVATIIKTLMTSAAIGFYYWLLRLGLWIMPEMKWVLYAIVLAGTASQLSLLFFGKSLVVPRSTAGR